MLKSEESGFGGLPFTISEPEVTRLVEIYYPMSDSLRWGHRDGRRSGECVMLFESARGASDALDLLIFS